MTNIKACPFCGGTGVIIKHNMVNGGFKYEVKCTECKASTYQLHKTDSDAIEAWNRRKYE